MGKILIVEDDPRLSSLLEKWFLKNGLTVLLASDGEQGLNLAQVEPYDVMLLDIGLPDKDGLAVLEVLRDRGDQHPVIVMTAFDFTEQELLSTGADAYVPKPFSLKDLLATVKQHLA